MSLHIRRLKIEDDLVALTSMIHRAYAPLAEQGMRYWASHQSIEDTASRCAKGETWLAEFEGVVVGTITLQSPEATGGAPYFDREGVAKIQQFCVDPHAQRTGIGAALMTHVESRAREMGATELTLDTSENATKLIHYYQRRGYQLVDTVDWRPNVNYLSVILSMRLID